MKKILSSVFIILLIILAYFVIFQGFSVASINVLSINQIIAANDELTNKIAETNSLLKKDYVSKKERLSNEVAQLLRKKEEYFNLAKISTEKELSKANVEEKYLIEYLWTRVGRHATAKGVNLRMDVLAGDAGEEDIKNLSFDVQGQYTAIIEFLYAIEGDSELNFKIESFKVAPNSTNSILEATFTVNGIRIKTEDTSAALKQSTTQNDESTTNQASNQTNSENQNDQTNGTQSQNTIDNQTTNVVNENVTDNQGTNGQNVNDTINSISE